MFTSTIEKEQYNFEHIELIWDNNDLKINFKEEGYATEAYLALQCFYIENEYEIESLFLVGKEGEQEPILKERLRLKWTLELSYKEFISWLTERASKLYFISSNDFEEKKLSGLEMRFKTQNLEKKKPTELGCKRVAKQIDIIKYHKI